MTSDKLITGDAVAKNAKNEKPLRNFIPHFIGSTLARSGLILSGSLGAFIGTLTLYFLSINKGILIDGSTVLIFTFAGIITGLALDLLLSLYSFLSKR